MKVGIPTPLRSYTAGRAEAEASGGTLDELTRDLDRRYPGIRFRFIDEQGRIRPHIKVFVNAEQVKDLGTTLAADDEVAIIQAFSGG